MIIVLIIFSSFLSISAIYANDGVNDTLTVNDDNNFSEIQNMIDNAQPGDQIYLKNTTYFGKGLAILINKNISIHGSDKSPTILDAQSKSNILSISKDVNVTISGLIFTNGNRYNAGAINTEGNLIIINSKFINNKADDGGAAICSLAHSTLKIYNSQFESNVAPSGTVIDAYLTDTLIENSLFINNVGHEGGAIYNKLGDILLINSTFINNSAVRGGGIYNNRGFLTIHNSKFYNNSVSHLGGGVKSWGMCEIYDSIISGNVAQSGGGAYISEFDMKVKNTIFENNRATDGGGLIADSHGHLYISNSSINNNFARTGGGIATTFGHLTLTDCNLNNNSASDNGGGIGCVDFDADIQNAILTNNHAKIGGGVYIGSIPVYLKNCTLNNNHAEKGGSIYNKGSLNLTGSNFSSNEADMGGVIYTEKLIKIYDSIFNNNKANKGGVIYDLGNMEIMNSKFHNNNVGFTSGVIYVIKGNVNISNSSFKSNKGSDEGGAIFIGGGETLINNTEFISNNAISYGGAIDNSGKLVILNSLFDNNNAYGAGAIDNGGDLIIINSKFINNNVAKNGGAIDNKGTMNAVGCIFENNIAGGNGGAVIARRGTNISYSIIYNNRDFNGFAVYNQTWDNNSFCNNWWGLNSPDFDKLLNFNIPDDFTWIIMDFINNTRLVQNENASWVVSLDKIANKYNVISKLDSCELLPDFNLTLSGINKEISVINGSYSDTFLIPKVIELTASVNNQSISLIVIKAQNVIEDDDKEIQPSKTKDNISSKPKNIKKSVKFVLKAKNMARKKAKKIKYYATLKTNKGKAIVGKKITFKIKGKKYSAKTNKKGIAKVYFKNLKVGKYKITVKYFNKILKSTLRVRK